jgi:cytidine deaminase
VPPLNADDRELIKHAAQLVEAHGDDRLHTVAAAGRARDGQIVAGLNVFHFTGGPCAEMVVVGMAAAAGLGPLATIVAVGDRGRGVMPPCGRCRQVLLDYQPELAVIVPTETGVEKVPISHLLPCGWAWTPEGGSEPPTTT